MKYNARTLKKLVMHCMIHVIFLLSRYFDAQVHDTPCHLPKTIVKLLHLLRVFTPDQRRIWHIYRIPRHLNADPAAAT